MTHTEYIWYEDIYLKIVYTLDEEDEIPEIEQILPDGSNFDIMPIISDFDFEQIAQQLYDKLTFIKETNNCD